MRYDWGARALAAAALAGGVALVVMDTTDAAVRRYFDQRALTTDVVSGVLVLLFTVLVVDQVVRHRQQSARSKAVGAHAAIVLAQAVRTVDAVRPLEQGTGDRDGAMDAQRTYMLMLLVAAPVFIEAPTARRFLEDAQRLAGTIARILEPSLPAALLRVMPDNLDAAVGELRASAGPLLGALTPSERSAAAEGGGPDPDAAVAPAPAPAPSGPVPAPAPGGDRAVAPAPAPAPAPSGRASTGADPH